MTVPKNNTVIITLGENIEAGSTVTVNKGATVANVKDEAGNILDDTFNLPVKLQAINFNRSRSRR